MGFLNKNRLSSLKETFDVALTREPRKEELLTERLFSASPTRRTKIIPTGITIELEPAEFMGLSPAKPQASVPLPVSEPVTQVKPTVKADAPPAFPEISAEVTTTSLVSAHEQSSAGTGKQLLWLVLLALSFAFALGAYQQVKKAQHMQTALQRQELQMLATSR